MIHFSIVIPTFNRPVQLARALSAIASVRYPQNRLEVIVVNDGGDIDGEEHLRTLTGSIPFRALHQPNRGPAAARNLGVGSARGDFLCFIDDDCVPPPDWLERLSDEITAAPDALIGGRTINLLEDNLFSQASQTLVDYVYDYYHHRKPGGGAFFASNNMAVERNAFVLAGGFDESFLTAEDREFSARWKAAGGVLHFAPDVVMYHAHDLTLRKLQRQHFAYGRGAFPYWEKTSTRGVRGIRIEPFAFYAGMLRFPFRQSVRYPAVVSGLVLLSQIANAAGFFYEGTRRLARNPGRLTAEAAENAEQLRESR